LTDIIPDVTHPSKVSEANTGNLANVSLHGHIAVEQNAKIPYNIGALNYWRIDKLWHCNHQTT